MLIRIRSLERLRELRRLRRLKELGMLRDAYEGKRVGVDGGLLVVGYRGDGMWFVFFGVGGLEC